MCYQFMDILKLYLYNKNLQSDLLNAILYNKKGTLGKLSCDRSQILNKKRVCTMTFIYGLYRNKKYNTHVPRIYLVECTSIHQVCNLGLKTK